MGTDKRYQVFVSSTYTDLREERQQVMHALLEMDCFPSGMELFPAANEDSWSQIKKVIMDCDYYILIVAGRYGSCDSDGMSYTEKEYQYAVELGKPIIAFLHKAPGQIAAEKCEPTDEGKHKLEKFKEALVRQKLCKYWDPATGLAAVVITSLLQLERSKPQVGWVRADELLDNGAVLNDLLGLRRQVEELKTELARTRVTAPKGAEALAQGEDLTSLHYRFNVTEGEYGLSSSTRTDSFQCTWNRLFGLLAPLMINEASEFRLGSALDSFVENTNRGLLERRGNLKDCVLSGFYLMEEDFQTVKVQFRSLGLITQSSKTHSAKSSDTCWTLTPYGDATMTQLRAIKRVSPSETVTALGNEAKRD